MTSNEEVLYIKKLSIVDVNNFVVRAIAIWFHLKGRNYVWSNKTLTFGVLFCQLGLQDIIKWKYVLHGAAWSRRTGRFWFLDHLNPSSYAKVRAITMYTCQRQKLTSGARHLHNWCLMEGVRFSALKMALNRETFNKIKLGDFEGYNFYVLSFFIQGRFQPQNCQKPNYCLGTTCNPSSVMFGKIWTGFRVLFLYVKSSLLIYRWGDGRLRQHTIETHLLDIYFSSSLLFI